MQSAAIDLELCTTKLAGKSRCDLLTADTREDSVKTTAAAYAIICDSPTRCLPLNEARPGIVPLMGLPGEVLLPVKRMTS